MSFNEDVKKYLYTNGKCNHDLIKVLNETYSSKNVAIQKNECRVCKEILTSEVERPTIREQRSSPRVFQKSKEIEAKFLCRITRRR